MSLLRRRKSPPTAEEVFEAHWRALRSAWSRDGGPTVHDGIFRRLAARYPAHVGYAAIPAALSGLAEWQRRTGEPPTEPGCWAQLRNAADAAWDRVESGQRVEAADGG